MKKTLTRKLLKKDYAARNRELRRYFLYAVFFSLLWIWFFPEHSLFPVVIVMGIAFAMYIEAKRSRRFGDVRNAYFRLLPATGKEAYSYGEDQISSSNVFYLFFGEHGKVEVLKSRDYNKAKEGHLYHVAFFSESDKPFACFDAEVYDLDPSFPVR